MLKKLDPLDIIPEEIRTLVAKGDKAEAIAISKNGSGQGKRNMSKRSNGSYVTTTPGLFRDPTNSLL